MYDIVPDPRKVLAWGIVLGILLTLSAWGLFEIMSAFIDVTITLQ